MKRGTKEDIQILTAIGMLISGVLLCYLGFFRSGDGSIHESVLWYFAQCLIWAGSIFGISIYVRGKVESYLKNFNPGADRKNDNKEEQNDGKQHQ